MITYVEAYQAKVALKMQLSNFSWFKGIAVGIDQGDGYCIIVTVEKIDNYTKKMVPIVFNNASVKLEQSIKNK